MSRAELRACAAASALLLAIAPAVVLAQAPVAPPPTGTIAYIEDRVRIHTIRPDGSDDRVVFGLTPEATSGIQSVAWRPDGARLAFASGHEELCSIWVSDLYLLDRDGSGLSRLTNGPACAQLAGLPLGTVRVTISNQQPETSDLLIHVQGMDTARGVVVEPGFQSTFELPVHDLGPDTPQFVAVLNGTTTWFDGAVYADVQAGTTVDAGILTVAGDGLETWGALHASWSGDGARLAYQQGLDALWQIPASAGPLDIGAPLFDATADDAFAATSPAWSPLDDRVLYQRYDTDPATIDLGRADAERPGDPIIAATLVNGIDWLPDGSGFVASDSSAMLENANLHLADLTSGAVTPITGYETGFALWPSVSPDGAWVAYSYSPVPLEEATGLELHIRHLGTGEDRVLVANGLNPDWGP